MNNILLNYFNNKESSKYKEYLLNMSSEIRRKIDYFNQFNDDILLNNFKSAKEFTNKENQLIDIFAITSIFVDRLLDLKMFDVQIQGAIALYEGKIAEMKTGEGKTITSVLPIVLHAVNNPFVHVVTVNEYLVQRDLKLLKVIFDKLELSSSVNLHEHSPQKKKENYKANILYSTATELGFDYLRDNMTVNFEDKYFPHERKIVIIDEIDMVLIDESRTPLIIGRNQENNYADVTNAQLFVHSLSKEDIVLDNKEKTVILSPLGVEKANKYFQATNIFSHENLMFRINQSLVANYLYNENVEYVIRNNEIVIVDQFTGRLSEGRRFSNGLHQALESKHSLEIKEENETIATITLQNFFRLYEKISGMTGTAKEEESELFSIYGLKIAQIDTNKPYDRLDLPMFVLDSKKNKFNKIIERTLHYHNQDNPVLIGTISIDESIAIADELKKHNISFQLLNANQDEKEANIIKSAGKKGAVTIATNMAGRGTDILVDENSFLTVIVTELNDSSRIDNQLKGRTARQGAKGITETIISLEDDFFKKIKNNLKSLIPTSYDKPIQKHFEKYILDYQKEIESKNETIRKHQLKFDEIVGLHRNLFYKDRDFVLTHNDNLNLIDSLTKSNEFSEKIKDLYSSNDSQQQLAKEIILYSFDSNWVKHLNNLNLLKDGISFRNNNNSPVIVSFAIEAELLFNNFKQDVITTIKDVSSKLQLVNDFNNVYENEVKKND